MFELADKNLVWWPVPMPSRGDDGSIAPVEVMVLFHIYTRAELEARRRAINQAATEVAEAREAPATLAAYLARQDEEATRQDAEVAARIAGWRGIFHAGTDTPVEFNPTNVSLLLSDEVRFRAVREGLLKASRGAVEKN